MTGDEILAILPTPNGDGEIEVPLANDWTLRSGVYADTTTDFLSGEYVRLVNPAGDEVLYWDQEEWRADPALVMGAILNSAAGYPQQDDD